MEEMKNLTVRQILDIIEYLLDARDSVNRRLTTVAEWSNDNEHDLIEERNKLDDLISTLYSIKT